MGRRLLTQSPVEDLCRRLESPDAKDRSLAARSCYWQRHAVLLHALLAAIDRESDPGVTALVARAIAAYHDDGLSDRVIALIEHRDPRVRACSIEGAWDWKNAAAARAVLGHSKDTSQRVRANVLVFYCFLDGRDIVNANTIATMLRSDRSWIRLAATYGLGRLRKGPAWLGGRAGLL